MEDLGGTAEDFERRLDVVCTAFDWDWDPRARVIWVTNWFSVNPPTSPNVVNSGDCHDQFARAVTLRFG